MQTHGGAADECSFIMSSSSFEIDVDGPSASASEDPDASGFCEDVGADFMSVEGEIVLDADIVQVRGLLYSTCFN